MDHRLRSCQLFPGAVAVRAPTGRARGSAFPTSLPASLWPKSWLTSSFVLRACAVTGL